MQRTRCQKTWGLVRLRNLGRMGGPVYKKYIYSYKPNHRVAEYTQMPIMYKIGSTIGTWIAGSCLVHLFPRMTWATSRRWQLHWAGPAFGPRLHQAVLETQPLLQQGFQTTLQSSGALVNWCICGWEPWFISLPLLGCGCDILVEHKAALNHYIDVP